MKSNSYIWMFAAIAIVSMVLLFSVFTNGMAIIGTEKPLPFMFGSMGFHY